MADHVLLSGGGSGGHVFPALAIAEQLALRGARVSFAGTATGPEARWVAAAGWEFHAFEARAVVGRGLLAKLGAVSTLLRSAIRARRLVSSEQVGAVIATGGYACVPTALAGWSRGVPLVLVEPNAVPGLANRWLSRLAKVAVTTHDATASELRCPTQTLGVPVRSGFTPRERSPGAEIRLLVLGGSQGAEAINEVLPAAIDLLLELRPDLSLRVVHQAGAGKAEAVLRGYEGSPADASVVEFIDDMPAAVVGADLVVSRAGAITLAELCAAGKPSLLLPLRGAAGGHQVGNAQALAATGAAVVVESLTPQSLAVDLETALERDRLAAMASAAAAQGRPSAAADVAEPTLALMEAA